VGSDLKLGDLNADWQESVRIAEKRPDLGSLDRELKAWWDGRQTGAGQ